MNMFSRLLKNFPKLSKFRKVFFPLPNNFTNPDLFGISKVFLLLLLPLTALAQTGAETGLPFIRNYSPKEYGAHAQNWTITQDARGVMYFGNGTGVLEYDGVSWRLLQLPNKSNIRALARAENGSRIYVGGGVDFGYFEPDSIGQMHYISLQGFVPEAQRSFGEIWTVHATGEGVYYQTRERLFRLTPDSRDIPQSPSRNVGTGSSKGDSDPPQPLPGGDSENSPLGGQGV